jgi:hypothetical protein
MGHMLNRAVLSGVALLAVASGVMLGATEAARADFLTFVSDTGSNTNNCTTVATPCRQFTGPDGALAKTDAGGVIHALPGEYEAFEVNKSVDIIADGGQASVVRSIVGPIPNITGNAGIAVVIGPGDVVRFRGFTLNPEHGIAIGGSGGIVHVEDCTLISVSNRFGIISQPSGASELYVKDTTIAREEGATGGGGIFIRPVGSGSAKVALDRVSVDDGASGFTIDGRGTSGVNSAMIRDSMISGSTGGGIFALDSGAGATNVAIANSTIAGNTTVGVAANGLNATVRMQDSQITGNGRGLQPGAGSKLISIGGNMVSGNTINGAFTATEAPK